MTAKRTKIDKISSGHLRRMATSFDDRSEDLGIYLMIWYTNAEGNESQKRPNSDIFADGIDEILLQLRYSFRPKCPCRPNSYTVSDNFEALGHRKFWPSCQKSLFLEHDILCNQNWPIWRRNSDTKCGSKHRKSASSNIFSAGKCPKSSGRKRPKSRFLYMSSQGICPGP